MAASAAVGTKEPATLYTLSFKFSLKHDLDEVYVAMCYPYTYSDCFHFLDSICQPLSSANILRRTSLCKTLAGNNMEMLIITNFKSS
jgi:cytosolic carboxypeptidase protein 2/3